MASRLNEAQLRALETVERVASCFSIVGTTFIFVTFVTFANFRKPINRLIFFASWGNILGNIATLLSQSGIRAGHDSHLCQFQGFLIQMFIPADAFWNLAIAVNVYMKLFKNYNADQLKALEWKYHLCCYGGPFIIALAYLFIDTSSRGRVYGPAILWCWISHDWAFLRIALLYAPAWICITACFTIYLMAGREIVKKRQQLRAFNVGGDDPNFTGFKTTDVQITREPARLAKRNGDGVFIPGHTKGSQSACSSKSYEQYTVSIASVPLSPRPPVPHAMSTASMQTRNNRVAMEANTAVWAYTKVALLFFVSLLITWLPSSINRLYSLKHPNSVSIPLTYTAGTVLSLMGFWNSVIYITTSREACRSLFAVTRLSRSLQKRAPAESEDQRILEPRRVRMPHGDSDSDSQEDLPVGANAV